MNQAICITPSFLKSILRSSFYGGRTYLYKPFSDPKKKVINLDINSLYPFAATTPVPSGPSFHNKNVSNYCFIKTEVNDFFGFFFIEYVSPANFPLLPVFPRKHP